MMRHYPGLIKLRAPCLAIVLALAPVGVLAALPVAATPTATPSPAFVGDTLRFQVKASDPAGDPLTYTWNFGDGSAVAGPSSESAAQHVFRDPGRYAVTVRVKDGSGGVTSSFILAIHLPNPVRRPVSAGPMLLDTLRNRLWCVNPDQGTVAVLDAGDLSLRMEVSTGETPRTLARAPDGSIWVANQGSSTVSVLDPETAALRDVIPMPIGSRPHGVVFNPDGSAAYVTLEGTGKLLKLDPASRQVLAVANLGPTPRGLAVTGDGKRILITRFLSPPDHSEVWEVEAASFLRIRTFILGADLSPDSETSGSGILNYLNAIVIAPSGLEAILPAVKANTRRGSLLSGEALTFESTVRTVTARIDLAANAEDPFYRNDFDNSSLASAVAFSPLGDLFFTALTGSNEVQIRDLYNNGALLEQIRGVGAAPDGLLVDGKSRHLYVRNFLDRNVAVYDISTVLANVRYQSVLVKVAATVKREVLSPQVLRGKRIFYRASDTAMSRDGYISCAVCHLDGASDGRVWDFTDRGEGLRRTTSLLGRAGMGMGPVHWSANFDEIQDFENDIRGPFGGIGFMADADFAAGTRNKPLGDKKAGLSPDLDALAAYVSSLTRVHPSPYRNEDGSPGAAAQAGEAIFRRADVGCTVCHAGPSFTDSDLGPSSSATGIRVRPGNFLVHDVGTLKPSSGKRLNDTLKGLDTPTLKGIWEGGPYLHDGSASTLMDVITTANPGDKHGKTSRLSASEKSQLVAYLLTLDDGPAPGTGMAVRKFPRAAGSMRLTAMPQGGFVRVRLAGAAGAGPVRFIFLDGQGKVIRAAIIPSSASAGEAGDRQWIWDGKNAQGRKVPPGLYLLQAECAGRRTAVSLPWF